jgi:hypothetical protein
LIRNEAHEALTAQRRAHAEQLRTLGLSARNVTVMSAIAAQLEALVGVSVLLCAVASFRVVMCR